MWIYGSAVLYYMLNELLTVKQVVLIGKLFIGVRFVVSARHINARYFNTAFFQFKNICHQSIFCLISE